jgi:hypothetical protein
MWFSAAFTARQSISRRKEGYHGRQRRKKRQRQSAKTESQPTDQKRQKEIADARSSLEDVGFAKAKPTIPEAFQLHMG